MKERGGEREKGEREGGEGGEGKRRGRAEMLIL